MQAFEFSILDWIQLHCRSGVLDALMPALSRICDHGEVWIALALVLLVWRRHRRAGAAVACALLLDVVCCNLVLKPLVARVRPCDLNTAVALLVPRPGDGSFPSGHTASSFAATAALLAAGDGLWKPAFALAVVMSFSRLYLYVHWPSDVLAGAVLGTVLGFWAVRLNESAERRLRRRRS